VRADSFSNIDSLRGTASLAAPRVVAAGYTAAKVRANASFRGREVALRAEAFAYGASATADGSVTVPLGSDPLALDLGGTAKHVDLRNLPRDLKVPPADTDVNATYHVTGSIPMASTAAHSPVESGLPWPGAGTHTRDYGGPAALAKAASRTAR